MRYTLGCPSFGSVQEHRNNFLAPIGAVELCKEVLSSMENRKNPLIDIQKEYMSILFALLEMEIGFSISCSVLEMEYKQELKGLFAGLSGEFGDIFNIEIINIIEDCPVDFASFPKDIATVLTAGTLINNQIEIPKHIWDKGVSGVLSSPYGEGGRVLSRGDVVLVSNHLTLEASRPIEKARVRDFDQMEVKLGLIPLIASGEFSLSGAGKVLPNDHLDRSACLIEGGDEKMHLVIDPQVYTYGKDEPGNWIIQKPKESLEEIGKVCDSLGIELHCPDKIEVPYALNLFQFEDRRILMTGGDASAYRIISKIVGKDMVTTTEVPIQLYPVFNYAGIGCMLNKQLPQIVLS